MKTAGSGNDLRVRRTHKLLRQALEELLSEPGQHFSSITVNQICEKAMVHRTTFYKHFEDKFDLLALLLSQDNNEYMNYSMEELLQTPFQITSKNPNLDLYAKIMQTQKNDEVFTSYIKSQQKETLKQVMLELNQKGKKFSVPIEIIAEVYSEVSSSLSIWWLQGGRQVPPEQMDHYLHELLNKDLFWK
ncbi:TetR/AcrR family transcriptional regulator [Paenibacillus sp.]|jgi:AcrR family transcriptional regulator|uniref:TetR/AcrR family transcriptional regulator n=1 Tax=Paenibacillus sp. TaxID=58172 RepID=UPI00283A526A|nr:TetR/AcrR family transcriptional regulator [Paenibacillus sp.]MDR0269911.1 TetR/AcrR family transcriptional regulator [Paenibacillus sp.]